MLLKKLTNKMLTFDDTDKLLHVVVCFAVVNYSSNGEDQLGLDLREPVQDALQSSTASEIAKKRLEF